MVTDVAIAMDVERMVAHAIETFGRPDYAVNNAGIEGKLAGITDLPEQEWDRVLDTNLKGTFLCLQSLLSKLTENSARQSRKYSA